eukprot:CAMPEP_0178942930 /NCGR_PEP_ID=MMETSP0789-20121207/2283_1 /TAXON_ID=3005 /ORGANISM="Rhizosolenia setigera, Strain CCMP 1694" /LENGTH=473 /DNA_ID=CAMNT_0020622425 /DNA_START=63 /DNA_END=1484 /DNA_ORIENTATION=-
MPLCQKLEGAAARLFAAICEHYMQAAEEQCNDTPEDVPIFSWLSPQQRLNLTKEVMVGALCEGEPMFPDTIQHNATYYALIQILYIKLEIELDEAKMTDAFDVGEDLLEAGKRQCDTSRLKRSTVSSSTTRKIDRKMEFDLMKDRAEKNRKKLEKLGDNVGEFEVKSDNIDKITSQLLETTKLICLPGPISKRERESIRPLKGDEPYVFYWRLLCDAALQEDNVARLPFPLSQVNFDFRCSSFSKWNHAMNLLFISKWFDIPSPKERALIYSGQINEYTLADPDKFPLIREIEKHTTILRKVYGMKWDPDRLSYDQRCIYAVTCREAYWGKGHGEWANEFLQKCAEQNIDVSKDFKFQKRLEIFRETVEKFPDGLKVAYNHEFHLGGNPRNYVPDKYDNKPRRCSGPKPGIEKFEWPCMKTENLQACSRCKVVLYCSRECQKRHWKEHKLVCAKLAAARKDKEQLLKLAKDRN